MRTFRKLTTMAAAAAVIAGLTLTAVPASAASWEEGFHGLRPVVCADGTYGQERIRTGAISCGSESLHADGKPMGSRAAQVDVTSMVITNENTGESYVWITGLTEAQAAAKRAAKFPEESSKTEAIAAGKQAGTAAAGKVTKLTASETAAAKKAAAKQAAASAKKTATAAAKNARGAAVKAKATKVAAAKAGTKAKRAVKKSAKKSVKNAAYAKAYNASVAKTGQKAYDAKYKASYKKAYAKDYEAALKTHAATKLKAAKTKAYDAAYKKAYDAQYETTMKRLTGK